MKKTLLMLSLVLTISAPTILEINAYNHDPSMLIQEETVDSLTFAPELRHSK